jgi:hypothetical protein
LKGSACGSANKNRTDSDQCRKTSIAGHKDIREDSDQSFPRGFDDPAADDSCGIAAKAHAHGQSLLAMGAGFFEEIIKVESDPGKVAQVLKQCE